MFSLGYVESNIEKFPYIRGGRIDIAATGTYHQENAIPRPRAPRRPGQQSCCFKHITARNASTALIVHLLSVSPSFFGVLPPPLFSQLRRTVSRGQMGGTSDYEQSQQRSPQASHTMFLEAGSNILLLKGGLRRRFGSAA